MKFGKKLQRVAQGCPFYMNYKSLKRVIRELREEQALYSRADEWDTAFQIFKKEFLREVQKVLNHAGESLRWIQDSRKELTLAENGVLDAKQQTTSKDKLKLLDEVLPANQEYCLEESVSTILQAIAAVTAFLQDNIEGMRKILKKFDKKLGMQKKQLLLPDLVAQGNLLLSHLSLEHRLVSAIGTDPPPTLLPHRLVSAIDTYPPATILPQRAANEVSQLPTLSRHCDLPPRLSPMREKLVIVAQQHLAVENKGAGRLSDLAVTDDCSADKALAVMIGSQSFLDQEVGDSTDCERESVVVQQPPLPKTKSDPSPTFVHKQRTLSRSLPASVFNHPSSPSHKSSPFHCAQPPENW
eukprot:gb/GEZN01005956.1/.p1 GENE.gb/GEZN01005956.1/~~gb/GEZN01005956.1/.p1  ORF type:complete len:400 (+),score=62.45 gb/GEZN01005956.1/:136-1200(+)